MLGRHGDHQLFDMAVSELGELVVIGLVEGGWRKGWECGAGEGEECIPFSRKGEKRMNYLAEKLYFALHPHTQALCIRLALLFVLHFFRFAFHSSLFSFHFPSPILPSGRGYG